MECLYLIENINRIMDEKGVFLKLLDERPRIRGSKRSLKEVKKLAELAYDTWKGMEVLGWIKWEEDTLIIKNF